jgi:enediyne biosynthesis protein E4
MRRHLRGRAATALAVVVIAVFGWAARLDHTDLGDPGALRARFAFDSAPLVPVPVAGYQDVRRVAPAYQHIEAWISAVGAATALTDLRDTGRDADVCLTDPRTDTVTVMPAPGTPAAYAPFVLDPAPLPFDRSTMAPMGCLPGDFDEDGRRDLLTFFWGRTPVLFLHTGEGVGPAAFTPVEVMPTGERWATETVTAADVDGDGHQDLVIGNYFPDESRLLDPTAGPDPNMQMHDSMSNALNGGRDRILLWAGRTPGGVTWRDASDALPADVAKGWTLAIGAQDLDGDLLPELYLAHDFGPDRLLRNRSTPGHVAFEELNGRPGFATPKSMVLGNDSFKGMGVDFGDIDGDGRTDLFVSNLTSPYGLMENHFAWINTGGAMTGGVAPFVDEGDELGLGRSGWAWDTKFGDFDNDGTSELLQATGFVKGTTNAWPQLQELALANDELEHDARFWPRFAHGADLSGDQPDAFFVRGADGRWADAADTVGVADRDPSRGISTGDVDGDGRLDYAVAQQFADSHLLHNRGTAGGASLTLDLRLPPAGAPAGPSAVVPATAVAPGSPATGATVRLTLPDGRTLTQQVDGGNGHASFRSPRLHFGLGTAAGGTADVTWRGRDGQVHRQAFPLGAGQFAITLGEGR